jgi:hypothetical protein
MKRSAHAYTEIALPENAAPYWELFEKASDCVYVLDMHGRSKPVRVQDITHDMTERQLAEEALQQASD